MFYVIDVGNSRISIMCYDDTDDSLVPVVSVPSIPDSVQLLTQAVLDRNKTSKEPAHAMLVSVVPSLTHIIIEAFNTVCDIPVEELSEKNCQQWLTTHYLQPELLGLDRWVNCIAFYQQFKAAGMVVDFGTATTISVVGSHLLDDENTKQHARLDAHLYGGVILPGPGLQTRSLATGTGLLPDVSLSAQIPERILGRSTEENILQGVYWGHIGQVAYLCRALAAECKLGDPIIAITGGFAQSFEEAVQKALDPWRVVLIPTLIFQGLLTIAQASDLPVSVNFDQQP